MYHLFAMQDLSTNAHVNVPSPSPPWVVLLMRGRPAALCATNLGLLPALTHTHNRALTSTCSPTCCLQIDLDTIETSNLNRQFLFRQHHVGKSKALVAGEVVTSFVPDAKITAYQVGVCVCAGGGGGGEDK
jgi:hypothetical protein